MRGEVLTAREGYVYTDGQYFGSVVYLRAGDDGSGWQEVPEEEASFSAQATEEDYRRALEEFGVML